MINKKVKILKTNSRLYRQLCEKCESFTQLTSAETYVKLILEINVLQSLQRQFCGFLF